MDDRAVEQPILQDVMPEGQLDVAAARVPSMRPVVGPWLFCDAAYGAQMALRRDLLRDRQGDVYAQTKRGLPAAKAFLDTVLADLLEGFVWQEDRVTCPDGHTLTLDLKNPLRSIGEMLQQDVCIMEKIGDEHVMTGAVLCFPASWTLSQKINKPLIRIHDPVDEYNASIAARVQRLFDGVQAGRPMWRANALRYHDPSLYHPRPENDPRPNGSADAPYLRSERQTVLRLSHPGAVAFMIHTTVVQVD